VAEKQQNIKENKRWKRWIDLTGYALIVSEQEIDFSMISIRLADVWVAYQSYIIIKFMSVLNNKLLIGCSDHDTLKNKSPFPIDVHLRVNIENKATVTD
jgi:hypothetical protein